MKLEEMRQLLEIHDRAAAQHDAQGVAATFAEDGVYENFSLDLRFEGRNAVELHYAGSYQMTPDMRTTTLAEIVGHDVIARLSTVSGTVKDSFMGVAAAGHVGLLCSVVGITAHAGGEPETKLRLFQFFT